MLTPGRFHGDIKPSNIFVAGDVVNNPYQVHFMLGDLGLSHFATMVEDNPSATGEDRGGSQAYSARHLFIFHPAN